MQIANGPRARPSTPPQRSTSAHPRRGHARPQITYPHHRRGRLLSPSGAPHLSAGTARRGLRRNLADLLQRLADTHLPQTERRLLEHWVATVETRLHDHRALRTNMATMILG